jgi:transcriptional antiterminator RfaH
MKSLYFKAGWYVAYTRPRHEKKVALLLSEAGITNFLPTTRKIRIWHDRKKYVTTPLFPSYIFIFMDCPGNYQEALKTNGVLYFVRQGKEISTISEDVINAIRFITGFDSSIEVTDDRFQAGQRITIQNGVFAGLDCEVVEHRGKSNILVRVNLLQRNVLMNLETINVLALSA